MTPIFIGGTGRSGTTILKQVLSCSEQVVSVPVELRVIIDPGGALDLLSTLTDRWSPYHGDAGIQRFRRLMLDCASTSVIEKAAAKLLGRLGIAPTRYAVVGLGQYFGERYYRDSLENLTATLSYHVTRGNWDGTPTFQLSSKIYETRPYEKEELAQLLAGFFDRLFLRLVTSDEQTHWIDDTPYNLLYAQDLLEMFPTMRLVHIYRDPRDVLVSHRKFKWGGDDVRAIAKRLSAILERWSELRTRLPDQAYTEIGLENLAASPDKIMEDICDFVGVGFDSTLEAGISRIRPGRVRAGIWRSELAPAELDAVLPYLSPHIRDYGYDLDCG